MYETSEHIVSVSSIIGIDFWGYLQPHEAMVFSSCSNRSRWKRRRQRNRRRKRRPFATWVFSLFILKRTFILKFSVVTKLQQSHSTLVFETRWMHRPQLPHEFPVRGWKSSSRDREGLLGVMVVVMTASLDCVLLELLFSLVESQGCETSAMFVCFPLWPCGSWITLGLPWVFGRWGQRQWWGGGWERRMAMKNCKMPLLILPMTGNRMCLQDGSF